MLSLSLHRREVEAPPGNDLMKTSFVRKKGARWAPSGCQIDRAAVEAPSGGTRPQLGADTCLHQQKSSPMRLGQVQQKGRGFKSRPVHHIYRLRFPSSGRSWPERFGFEAWGFSGLRHFPVGTNPHNASQQGCLRGVYSVSEDVWTHSTMVCQSLDADCA